MEITASMLVQLLQEGKLDIGCTILTLDPDLDFVRRNGTMVSEDLKALLRGIKHVNEKLFSQDELDEFLSQSKRPVPFAQQYQQEISEGLFPGYVAEHDKDSGIEE